MNTRLFTSTKNKGDELNGEQEIILINWLLNKKPIKIEAVYQGEIVLSLILIYQKVVDVIE